MASLSTWAFLSRLLLMLSSWGHFPRPVRASLGRLGEYARGVPWHGRHSRLKRYGLAVVFVLLTLLVRLATGRFVAPPGPFMLFIAPVLAASWYGGLGPGLTASLASLFLVRYYLIAPYHRLLGMSEANWVTAILFLILGACFSMAMETLLFQRYRAQERADYLEESEERFRLLVEGVHDYALYMLDPKGYIRSWNKGAERLTGYAEAEAVGRHFSFFYPSDVQDKLQESALELRAAVRDGQVKNEGWRERKDGSQYWASIQLTSLKDDQGRLRGFAKISRDMTERRQSEETLRHIAFHDVLTGLPNRLFLQERMDAYISRATSHSAQLAVLFLDLDRFKVINDILGHQVGDQVLREVAGRLQEVVGAEDTVARFGGDEFIVILDEVASLTQVLELAERIMNCLRPELTVENHRLHLDASLGIALYPSDGQDTATLFKHADAAVYQAKEAGRGTYKFYSHSQSKRASQRLILEAGLRRALENQEFTVHYQPIVDLKPGTVVGAEALVRWNHPELGTIMPSEFIPLAEETGLITDLDEWVMGTACRQVKQWEMDGLQPIRLSVNLSAREFVLPNLPERIQELLVRSGLHPQQLELEITESIAMQSIDSTVAKLEQLSRLGVRSAIDDFGIGFSSLNYLKRLPIQKLKIDRSFVSNCTEDLRDAAIVRAIITMAHTLHLHVLAEGVENEDQLKFLASVKCDYIQGYKVSPPVPADAFAGLLAKGKLT